MKNKTEAPEDTVRDIRLSLEQERAVDLCANHHHAIVGVTGGAGVGKTLVLKYAYAESRRQASSVVLCAPTGRAAKRIQELTGIKAVTVHRLLEYPTPDMVDDGKGPKPVAGEPKRCAEYKLREKIVYVDEASMLSPTLYNQLMAALPYEGAIRFFGDNNQLPPVESGKPPFISILKEFPSVELTYNYRSEDAIVANAQRILDGQIPIQNDRFRVIYNESPIRYMLQFITKEFLDDQHQIIMPTRRGSAGTQRINPSVQMRFNPKGEYLRLDRYDPKEAKLVVRSGDKFLWIKNDYQLKLFNGEIGRVSYLDADEGTLGLHTSDGQEVLVPPRIQQYDHFRGHMMNYDPRKQIELGYAVTTHKAQGSEFDYVIYCMSVAHAWLLSKQNFYTAITRAKKMVIVITDRRAMSYSMKRAKTG